MARRDIQELFQIGKRTEFLRLCELLLRQSGELCSVTNLAKHTGVTRPTIMNWLEALETTHFVHLLRPFHGGGRREVLAQPKVYAFDTGFVCHTRGWAQLRPEDCGQLLEHLTLDTIRAANPSQTIHFWRDKNGKEIDFVFNDAGHGITAIECKWTRNRHNSKNLDTFRSYYPRFVSCPRRFAPICWAAKTCSNRSTRQQARLRICPSLFAPTS